MLNMLSMAENYICIAPMSLYSDLRLTSGTEQFTSKPSEQVVLECVSGLQSASKSFPGMESVPLNLSYHPFYSALLEPEKAAEYASKVCCTSHQYQVAITFPVVLSITHFRMLPYVLLYSHLLHTSVGWDWSSSSFTIDI